MGRLARGRSRRWTLLSLAITALIALIDALIAKNAILIGLLIVGPLVSSARSGPRGVLAVSAWAIVLGVLLGIPDEVFGTGEHLLRVSIVMAGGALAIWTAGIRQSRERTAELLGTQAAVARILASSDSLPDAGRRVLEAVGLTLGWEAGALWRVRRRRNVIECVGSWASEEVDAAALVEQGRGLAFARGEGMPGGVWRSGQPLWMLDLAPDSTFPRSAHALECGLTMGLCFPLRSAGGIVGAMEFYAHSEPQPDRHVLDLMDALGGQVGEYLERTRAESLARENEAAQRRLALIVESSDDAILSKDREGIVTSWNSGAQRLYGWTPEEAIGRSIRLIIPEERKNEEQEILDAVLRDEPIHHYETIRVRKDGSRVEVSLSISPIKDADGTIVGASVIAHDITERKRAERRAAFLAEGQTLLGSSLDYVTTLENLARLSVPFISDWCIVDVVSQEGKMERLATAHIDPQKEELAAELRRRFPQTDLERGAHEAIAVGRSTLITKISDEQLVRAAHDEEHLEILRDLGLQSSMMVPLMARDRSIGAITFLSAESGRRFDEEDLALAEDLAGRAGIAVENARLYGERSYIASTLQQALLPDNLPEIPGVELAARYVAGGEGTEVGGDFYDIYRAAESTWGLAIGDVRGKGPRAAAVTALARYTLRTASLSQTQPSRVLETLNEAMLRQRSDDRFCTVAYASIEPSERGGITMNLGVGGHPLPLLLRCDGSVERVGRPGTLIGLVPDPEILDVTVELSPGESLVLYTDGVSEARSREDGLFGEERLIELLRDCATRDAAFIAERIEQQVLDFQDQTSADDLAVLVMRVRERSHGTGERTAERFVPLKRPAPA